MEGFCRASSPLSIADSGGSFKQKRPENRGLRRFSLVTGPTSYGLSTSVPQGWTRIHGLGQCETDEV